MISRAQAEAVSSFYKEETPLYPLVALRHYIWNVCVLHQLAEGCLFRISNVKLTPQKLLPMLGGRLERHACCVSR